MRILNWGPLGAGHIPVTFAIAFVIMLGSTYCFAVWHGDVDPLFPYISASGNNRPESCFFGLLMNFCAGLSILIVYLRYSLITELNRSYDDFLKTANRLGMYVGFLGAGGMFVVANFQETAVVTIHLTAAFVCFGGGVLYMIIEAWMSHRMYPLYSGRPIAWVRTLIALIGLVAFVNAAVFGVYAAHVFHQKFPDLPTPRPWFSKLNQPGYSYHVTSAVCEWIVALNFTCFFLTYSREFEKIRVEMRVQPLVTHLDHSPTLGSTIGFSAVSP